MTTTQPEPSWLDRMNDPDVILGAHINAMRGFKLCTQAELGQAIGVSQSTMAKKLRGSVSISFGELLQLADFFQVSVEDLIPPQYAGERVIGVSRARRDSNPKPSDREPRHLRLVAS